MEYELNITEKGDVEINGTKIEESALEKSGYTVREKEQQEDDLMMWISECKQDRQSDKWLMKEDLKMLMGKKDDYIFSSMSTNDFILKSSDKKGFDELCKEILKLNTKPKKKVKI